MPLDGSPRFELRRELGRGGMGVVYQAFDTERQESVALKMLHHADGETIVRLKQEFRSLSEIAHPHLVCMHELLCFEEEWFFTMEFIPNSRNLLDYIHTQHAPIQIGETPLEFKPIEKRDTSAQWRYSLQNSIAASRINFNETENSATFFAQPIAAEPAQQPDATLDPVANLQLTVQNLDATVEVLDATVPVLPVHAGPAHPLPDDPILNRSELTAEHIETIVNLFSQLAAGVEYLHAHRKLHRDLKPGNIMVRGDGRVVILDFGLVIPRRPKAATVSQSPDPSWFHQSNTEGFSSDRVISGTIPYMAPEQAAGLTLTEASDWYAVGVMLYEALAGELPFRGNAMAILQGKQKREAPEVARLRPDIPPSLATLCNALLRKDPAQRPTGEQVRAALGSPEATAQLAPAHEDDTAFVGRQSFLDALQQSFTASHAGPYIVQLHGRSGSGKTALMRHFLDSLQNTRPALVFRGRCYEQESVPYKTLDGVADALAVWLASLPPADQQALTPPTPHALAKIFPVFRSVHTIARAAAAADQTLELAELRTQAFQTLGQLFRLIGERFPLILCIDDLQWGDRDGVEMLRVALAEPGLKLLLIATYRDEYLASSSALRAFAEMQAELPHLTVKDLPIDPLSREESLELIRQRIPAGSPEVSAEDLEGILEQAAGSPYFLEELALHLASGRPLPRSRTSGLDEILWNRISALSGPELRLLETIAVSGQPIRLTHAQKASMLEDVPLSVMTSLRMHHLVRSNGLSIQSEVETYHDRIRETVLNKLTRESRRERHSTLAFTLEGSGDVTSDTLAVHFELGGRPEKAGQFYELAAGESVQALAFNRAEELYKKARGLVNDLQAQTRIAEHLIHLYTDLARFPEAYALGREALAALGMKIPARFQPPAFAVDLFHNWRLTRSRPIESILDLPRATDTQHIARTTLLAAVGKAAYQIRPELCISILLKMVNDCIKHGNVQDSAIGFMAVGAIFYGGILGRYDSGYQYGRLALNLVDRYDARRIRAEVNFVIGYFGTSWKRPAQEAEQLWQTAQSAGLETGDLFHLGCASCATILSQFMRGVPLPQIAVLATDYQETLNRYRLAEPNTAIAAVQQAIQSLITATPPASSLPACTFGSRHLEHYQYILTLQRQYLFGEHQQALATGRRSAQFMKDSKGMLHATEHILYFTLTRLALAASTTAVLRSRSIARTKGDIRRFERWAIGCPQNFAAKALLLRAEWYSAKCDYDRALPLFEQSASAAVGYDQLHIAALANQLAGVAASHAKQSDLAHEHLGQAAGFYIRWGAPGYATRLQSSNPGPAPTKTLQ